MPVYIDLKWERAVVALVHFPPFWVSVSFLGFLLGLRDFALLFTIS